MQGLSRRGLGVCGFGFCSARGAAAAGSVVRPLRQLWPEVLRNKPALWSVCGRVCGAKRESAVVSVLGGLKHVTHAICEERGNTTSASSPMTGGGDFGHVVDLTSRLLVERLDHAMQ